MVYDTIRTIDSSQADDPAPSAATIANFSAPATLSRTSTAPSKIYASAVGDTSGGGKKELTLTLWALVEVPNGAEVGEDGAQVWASLGESTIEVGAAAVEIPAAPGRFFAQVTGSSVLDGTRLLLRAGV